MCLIHKLIRSSIRNRVLTYFLIFGLTPTLSIGLTAYFISIEVTTRITENTTINLVGMINDETSKVWSEALMLGEMVANDPSIQQLIREPLPGDVARKYSETLLINSRLNFIHQYRDKIFAVNVIGSNGGVYKSTYHTQLDSDLRQTWWYDQVIQSDQPVWFAPHLESFATRTSDNSLFTIGLPIDDKATGRRIGVVLVDIEEQVVQSIYETRLVDGGEILLLDQNSRIITYPLAAKDNPELIEQYNRLIDRSEPKADPIDSSGLISATPIHPMYVYRMSELNGWQTVGIIPYSALTQDSLPISWFIWISILVMSVLSFVMAMKFSTKIASPIKTLRNMMQVVETGDLSIRIEPGSIDELGQLTESFNTMITRLDQQIKLEIEHMKALRKSELRALQAQVNPHFLYNTLDSISWMARGKDVSAVEKTIDALTSFYRIGISRGKDVITVEEEIKHVESYLMIQQMNYAFSLDYSIEVPTTMYPYLTVKLILQPLVENAIYHGIKKREGLGFIRLQGIETDDSLTFVLSDTGIGMSAERLQALNQALQSGVSDTIDSYGVLNVQERIKLYFGDQYGLHYTSEPNLGTTVTVKLPKNLPDSSQ